MRGKIADARTLIALAAMLAPLCAQAQARRPATPPAGPAISASQRVMAGSMLSVIVSQAPAGARLAVARPGSPASSAILVEAIGARPSVPIPVPGLAADYELRLTRDEAGVPVIVVAQPLIATEAQATLAAPTRIRRGAAFPARGIGPNGERDRVVLVPKDAPAETSGPSFFPAENVEAVLDAPDTPGDYELRYIMNAPLAEGRVLARQGIVVE
ncbi:hypothetical protein [Bosea sp. (in: a-proteobacteria)]|uniref:hypothetical protein n=1 Tax=Bosea sp. (in: a-proteobacteria) TaxID=1871050 RepID=UPI0035646B20